MAFSVSFGDAYLMGQLAFKIGQAFTKGSKSAPAEFREVESQLYSLSAALEAFASARESGNKAPLIVDRSKLPQNMPAHFAKNQDIILGMLRSCEETLKHLESVVEKYSVIGARSVAGEPRLKRWSHELKANWKKVAWTTEGGDLAVLKSNLTIHTNSLSLILGVVINSQADRLQSDMDHISAMLGDIHEWYVDNLKGQTGAAAAPTLPLARGATFASTDLSGEPAANALQFELHQQSRQTCTLVCPRASLGRKASGAYYSTSRRNNQLFSCNCAEDAHWSAVEAYRMSPLSFTARISGDERSWLFFKVANTVTDQLATLVIKGVPLGAMHDFEALLVHSLGVIQTRQILDLDKDTMLAYVSHDDGEAPKVHILDLVSNATTLHTTVTAVEFTSGSVHYRRDSIESVQMLHYKSIALDRMRDEAVLPQSAFEERKDAEIFIAYRKQEQKASGDGTVRVILHLRCNSKIQYKEGEKVVSIESIECTAYDSDGTARPTASAAVAFNFASAGAAAQFYKEMEALRMDLFVMHLEYPRADEKTLVKLQAQDVYTDRMHIRDADMTILQSTSTKLFRLVVRSRSGYSVLSQELARDFFQKLAVRKRPDFSSPSFEVHMEQSGRRMVKRRPQGFTHLEFPGSKIEQVFAMALAAVGGSSQLYLTDGPRPTEGVAAG